MSRSHQVAMALYVSFYQARTQQVRKMASATSLKKKSSPIKTLQIRLSHRRRTNYQAKMPIKRSQATKNSQDAASKWSWRKFPLLTNSWSTLVWKTNLRKQCLAQCAVMVNTVIRLISLRSIWRTESPRAAHRVPHPQPQPSKPQKWSVACKPWQTSTMAVHSPTLLP